MKRLMTITLVLVPLAFAGCGGGAPPPPFDLTVDTVTVEGTVSDTFDPDVAVNVNGTPVTVTADAFTAACDMTAQNPSAITAEDNAANAATLTVQVQ